MLTGQQLDAARLVAADRLTNVQIARKLEIAPRTLDYWKALPEFKAEVERLLNAWAENVEKRGIADRRRRIYRLNDRWRRLQAVIEERAEWFEYFHAEGLKQAQEKGKPFFPVPGGETGMICIHPTQYGDEYKVDTGHSAEMRALEEQAAIELGQWKPKQEVALSGMDGGPIQIQNLSALTDDELATLIGLARKLQAGGPGSGTEAPQPEPDGETVSGDGPVS